LGLPMVIQRPDADWLGAGEHCSVLSERAQVRRGDFPGRTLPSNAAR
jgi:hypothetical protein